MTTNNLLPRTGNCNIELSGQPGKTSRECARREDRDNTNTRSFTPYEPAEHLYKIPGAQGTESPQSPCFSPYKDILASPATSKAKPSVKKECQYLMTLGECEHHDLTLGKIIFCGKEWCPTCSQEWSVMHQRRFSRILSKAKQLKGFGYFVIEWPDRYRGIKSRVYSKIGLRNTTNIIVDVLAGQRKGRKGRVGGYFDRGIIRWHYFGDKNVGKWNPHINVITESGYIPPAKLNAIKSALREGLNCLDLIVNYSYRRSVAEMIFSLKYITRATFKDRSWDTYMADQLYGFLNIRSWGKWISAKDMHACPELSPWPSNGQQYYETIAVLESSKCPKCGGHIKWMKPISSHYLDAWQADGKTRSLGGGYFEIDTGQYKGKSKSVILEGFP